MPSEITNAIYSGISYYCQYADAYVECGDKKCSECVYCKNKHKRNVKKNEHK